jgi:spore photoproduct lyase
MNIFKPAYVLFRENALEYPLGKKLYKNFREEGIEIKVISAHGPFPFKNNISFREKFYRAKRTIVVSVRSINKFQSCKPSAHYQLPLVTGCPGHCHYCYLSTNLGKNPYIRIYVNLDEIFAKAEKYINERVPEITIFEGSATSDPIPVEKWTGSLASAITFFANKKLARFRFVTKFTEIDSLLDIEHKGKTEFRFSLNSKYSINKFEPSTPVLDERIKAAAKVYKARYPLGFLIAPIFIYEGWKNDYENLFINLKENLCSSGEKIYFELITHRFTKRAKEIIEKVYPDTKLPMNEETRQFKYGQFGYGKYVYPKEQMKEIEFFFRDDLNRLFPEAEIKYFV